MKTKHPSPPETIKPEIFVYGMMVCGKLSENDGTKAMGNLARPAL